jgi:hypothetical protein
LVTTERALIAIAPKKQEATLREEKTTYQIPAEKFKAKAP